MKGKVVLAAGLGMILGMNVVHAALDSEIEKLSYTIGADLGKNFKSQGVNIDEKAFVQGLEDATAGKSLQMSDEAMKQTLQTFQQKIMAKRMADFQKESEKNKKDGEAFLAANKGRDGVKTTESGLQYKVLQAGNGVMPSKEDMVTVEYTGKLLNGKVFDSTKGKGKPATFKLSQVIPGWVEALQMMKEGATWEVVIPSNLAYGARGGMGGPIGPNETLIFNIHLISVKKEAAKAEASKNS